MSTTRLSSPVGMSDAELGLGSESVDAVGVGGVVDLSFGPWMAAAAAASTLLAVEERRKVPARVAAHRKGRT